MENSSVSKSFFCVLNHPEEHGYTGAPEEICDKMKQQWIDGSSTRTGAWAYCISASGLKHVHMVLEDKKAMRFTAVKTAYPAAHIEITRGSKNEAEAYINKDPPYDEKDEKVVCVARHGEIQGRQGKRSDMEEIAEMLDSGMTPSEIFQKDMAYRRLDKLIRNEFQDRKYRETPAIRKVTVHYIVGDSGSGKSYTFVKLCEEVGEDKIYHTSDYQNGGFDKYECQPILFLDEYKGQLPYSQFLTVLDVYKTQLHSRFTNIYALWNEVYITSVMPPEDIYSIMVPPDRRDIDGYEQLRRRISDITYCFKADNGEFRRYTIPMSKYTIYRDLRSNANR